MKKLIMMSAVMLCGALFAEGEALTSKNIVGYTSTEVKGGKYYLIASQFQNTDGNPIKLSNFVTFGKPGEQGREYCTDEDSAMLQVWSGDNYDTYYFLKEDIDGEPNVWSSDMVFKALDVEVNLGIGVFLRAKVDDSITVAGQVASDSAMDVPVEPGSYNLIANPYPMSFDLNDTSRVDFKGCLTPSMGDDAPTILVWNEEDYKSFYYIQEDCWSTDYATKSEDSEILPNRGFFLKYNVGGKEDLVHFFVRQN